MKPPSFRAAIYARVSTTDQNNTVQVRELTEYVERRGWQLAGVYQDQISGYGGIKHCLIPSPKHVLLGFDKNGKLVDTLYAKEQTAQSMLKILGYM